MSTATSLTNNLQLYCCSMGKVFRVTHVCDKMDEANRIMARNRDVALIAEDEKGRCYLATQYGAVAPSAILEDYRRYYAKHAYRGDDEEVSA